MKSLAIGAGLVMLALLPAAPALADSNVLCVQQELASRGYNPGPLDGQLGAETQYAAQAAGFALSYGNAGAVCRDLRPSAVRTFSFSNTGEPAFVDRLAPRRTFNSAAPQSNCPAYVIDTNDPCF